MFLKVRPLEFEARKPTVIMNSEDAEALGVKTLNRVELSSGSRKAVAMVNVAEHFINKGEIGLYGGG
jgi:anaerobic selenocysteine-containing dehydrogenase